MNSRRDVPSVSSRPNDVPGVNSRPDAPGVNSRPDVPSVSSRPPDVPGVNSRPPDVPDSTREYLLSENLNCAGTEHANMQSVQSVQAKASLLAVSVDQVFDPNFSACRGKFDARASRSQTLSSQETQCNAEK